MVYNKPLTPFVNKYLATSFFLVVRCVGIKINMVRDLLIPGCINITEQKAKFSGLRSNYWFSSKVMTRTEMADLPKMRPRQPSINLGRIAALSELGEHDAMQIPTAKTGPSSTSTTLSNMP